MRIVAGGLSFAICAATPALLLSLAAGLSGHATRPDPVGDVLLAGYFVAMSTFVSTLGFLIPTSFSASWRQLATSRAVIIAGGLGLIAPIATLAVLGVTATAVLPFFRSAPWLAITLMHGLPGLMLGTVALLIAKMWHG